MSTTTTKPFELGKGWDNARVISKPSKVEGSEVYETFKYSMFTKDIKNRPIHEEKVQFFMKQFKLGKFFLKEFPMVVDKSNTILDGQHRFEAAKRLEYPVYFKYSDSLTIDNIVDVQINAGWKTTDYVHAFIKQGKQDYVVLSRFMNRYKMTASVATSLLVGTAQTSGLKKNGFYNGTFKVKDETKAHEQAKVIYEIGTVLFSLQTNAAFCSAVVKIMQHPDFSEKRMMEQLKKYSSIFHRQVSQLAYIRALEELYNYRAYKENKIRFL